VLEVIEVQTGGYLGEDDIVRFDDTYGRCTSILPSILPITTAAPMAPMTPMAPTTSINLVAPAAPAVATATL
jgi:mannose-1-phosphate guanylyltransferase/mannose-6-phosphate isomerase